MIFNKNKIENLPKKERIHLINSISGFKSANLIGTRSPVHGNNLAIFSSVVHLGSDPALLGVVFRPASVPRHTLQNIRETSFYTINSITSSLYKKAHLTSQKYALGESEFKTCEIEDEEIEDFPAPFVKGSPLRIGMKCVEEITIQSNQTILMVGECLVIEFPEDIHRPDGSLNLSKANVVTISGLDTYNSTEEIEKMPYVKL